MNYVENELSEIEWFCSDVYEIVGAQTNFKSYEVMSEESRKRWQEKLTIMIVKAYSPRKNYDISKDDVREMIKDALAFWMKPVDL